MFKILSTMIVLDFQLRLLLEVKFAHGPGIASHCFMNHISVLYEKEKERKNGKNTFIFILRKVCHLPC